MPDAAAAATKTDDAQPIAVAALRLGPGRRGVQIGKEFGVGLGVDDWQDLLDVVDLGKIDAIAKIIIGRDRECAEMAEAARDVLDPLMQPENLHANKNNRRVCHPGW